MSANNGFTATGWFAALRLAENLEQSDQAPDTYAEFLLRTSAVMLHEPPARCR